MSNPALLESNKRPGLHYALTTDCVELPVVDVTHPAFSLTVTDSEQRALVDEFLQSKVPFSGFPKSIRTFLFRVFLRGSVLAQGIHQSQGTFMSGMHAYLLKLGPDMLGRAYAKPIDRKIAASLPALSARLRLQDMAYRMADTLQPALSHRSQPLYFINIAGGPAIDSLNALLVLNKRLPGSLAERDILIDVLDLDDAGPQFGEAALSALSSDGGPLHGIRIVFRHIRYDWGKPRTLEPILSEAHRKEAIVMASSEGGLFEYGSDEDIASNLSVLRTYSDVHAVVGSVTRADEPMRRLRETSTAKTQPRGLAVFRSLVEKAGWHILSSVERPFSDQVVLT